ncbi:shikimate dehydrogenase [Sporichthya polymorpha]|uniref:shikimate dehydrogenase n=1 Tax=Sporichthya polymorpha TaxID=35751 RepID=UPI0003627DD0|nr:shikimate dehydrogenase [Sporichthya polymorpha]
MTVLSRPPAPVRRAAVLGSPIRHSLSPVLHAAAYEVLGLDWTYDAHEVAEDGLGAFLGRLGGPELPGTWAGLSLTMPLKRAAIPLCTELDEVARVTTAANTLTFPAPGEVHGANTDVPGMRNALAAAGVGGVERAAVLGGGATAAAAVAALGSLCRGTVEVYVRTPDRAAELRPVADHYGLRLEVRSWEDAAHSLAAPLVVATTPKGAADALGAKVPESPGVLFDVLYDPWPTPLAAAWSAAGGLVLGGLDLLVHQAVLQVELMTGSTVDRAAVVTAMTAAGEAELSRR